MKRPRLSLPKNLELIEGMALGNPDSFPRGMAGLAGAALNKWQRDLFEHAVWDALEAAGLRVLRLGHHAPVGESHPDAVAVFPNHPGFALIIDAKVATAGYRLPKSDRLSISSYVKHYSTRLTRANRPDYQSLVVVIVSSAFSGNLDGRIDEIKRECEDTTLSRVLLMPAKSLAELVQTCIEDARLDSSFYEELLPTCPSVVSPADIKRARKARIRLLEVFP